MNARSMLACFVLLYCCASPAKDFRWSSQGDAGTMDPHAYTEVFTDSINGLVYEYLVARGKDYSIVPALAVSWSNPEPTRWVFNLRRGVKFHDGSPFTADDVVFSFNRARESANYRVWATLAGTPRKIDDYTVELSTAAPNPALPEVVAVLFVMSKSWCEKHGVTRPQDFAGKEETFAVRNAMGTGPFRLTRREPGVATHHERNADWWGHKEGLYQTNIERIAYFPIANAATRMAALRSGQLEFVLDPPVQDVAKLREDRNIRIWTGDEMRAIFLGFDQARDELLHSDVKGRNPFKDRRVRLALYHAIDSAALNVQVMRGLSSPTGIALPDPARAGVPGDLDRRPPFDPGASRRLLAEAGYPDGFGFTLHCPNDRWINDERICLAIATMWSRIGLKVNVDSMPKAQYFPKALKRDVSAFLLGWGGNSAAPIFFYRPVLRSPSANGAGNWNLGNVRHEELDRLIDAIETETVAGTSRDLVSRAVRLIQDEVLVIPLHRQVIPWASRANISLVHMPNNWLVPVWVRIQ